MWQVRHRHQEVPFLDGLTWLSAPCTSHDGYVPAEKTSNPKRLTDNSFPFGSGSAVSEPERYQDLRFN